MVDLEAERVARTLEVAGDEPGRVAFGHGRAYVALRRGGAVLAFAPEGDDAARYPVCAAPRGLAVDGDVLHVACAGGDLVTLDEGGRIRRRARLDTDLRDVVVSAGRLFVTRFRSAELLEVDDEGAVVSRRRPLGDLHLVAGGEPTAPAVAWRTVAGPGDEIWMLHQRHQLTPVVTDQPDGYGTRHSCGSVVQAAVTVFDPDGDARPIGRLRGAVLAVDLAPGPELAVAVPGAGATGMLFVNDLSAPADLDALHCLVTRRPPAERDVVAVARGASGTLYAQGREPAVLYRLPEAAGVTTVTLSEVSAFDAGHDLFHRDAGGGIACASCHPEGQDDGHTWLFADIGLRRTQVLTGGLKETAPFHWDGDMADFQMLAREVLGKRMGGPRLPAGYADALLSWLDVQPGLPVVTDVEAPAVTRGRDLFHDPEVGCAGCHVDGGSSDELGHDVGTGGVFQTPRLRGVSTRLPLLHHGCATTLAERFDPACGGGDRHGRTSHLSEAQVTDLTAFLATL